MTEEKDIIQQVDEELDALDEEMDSGDDSPWNWGGSNQWIWGIVLVLGGVLLMLRNFGLDFIDVSNWWAVFILVPGISMLAGAFNASRNGQAMGSQGFWGGFMVLLAASFFFAIDFSLIWPVFLILAGVGLLFKAF